MKFVFGRSLRLREPPTCPVCMAKLDGVTPVDSEGKPKPEDFSVCVYCGVVLRFDFGLRLREATKDDLAELRDKQPATLDALMEMVGAARALIVKKRRKMYRRN